MKRTHAALIAVVLAFAVLAGTFAALRTTQLGARSTTPSVSYAAIAAQNRQLDRAHAALLAQLRRRPPALPALAKPAAAAPAAVPAAAQTVVYVRPKPIVHIIHRHGGDHEAESGHDGSRLDD